MIKAKMLNEAGISVFLKYLDVSDTQLISELATDSSEFTSEFHDVEIDPRRKFESRYSLGAYLCEQLRNLEFNELMSPKSDGL